MTRRRSPGSSPPAPAALKGGLERAGAQGLLVLDAADSVDGFGDKQDKVARSCTKIKANHAAR